MNVVAVALAATTLLMVLLRLAFTFRENAQLYALTRHESVTDPLTGLGNRRKLLSDLERVLGVDRPPRTLLVIFDLNGFKLYNDRFGHPAGDALLQRLAERFSAVLGPSGDAYRLGGDEFCVVVPLASDGAESVVQVVSAALSERGEGFEVTASFGSAVLPVEAGDVSRALAVADERLYAQKHHRRLERDPTVRGFLEGLAIREPDLLAHLDGVGELSVAVGARLGVTGTELDELFRAARLHDLGKLAVPEEILNKAEPLDEREWEFIRQHTVVGERILRASPAFRGVASIVRSSHENWDGSGYPDRLSRDEIPLASRIIRVCDAFSAMTSARPYRAAVSVSSAVAELERCSGREFDPDGRRASSRTSAPGRQSKPRSGSGPSGPGPTLRQWHWESSSSVSCSSAGSCWARGPVGRSRPPASSSARSARCSSCRRTSRSSPSRRSRSSRWPAWSSTPCARPSGSCSGAELAREAGFRRSGILPLDPRLRRGTPLKASPSAPQPSSRPTTRALGSGRPRAWRNWQTRRV